MSDESIKPPTKSNNSLEQYINYIVVTPKIKFDGHCLKQDKVTFTHGKVVNICIVYEINLWPFMQHSDFMLENSLFGAVKLTKNADPDKYKYPDCSIGFDVGGSFSQFDGSGFGKSMIIFGVDMSSLVHVQNKKKYILILGSSPTQGSDDTTLTAEKEYLINFTELKKKFCLNLHYNGAEIHKFKAKNSEIMQLHYI